MCSKLGQKDARLGSIRTRLPRVSCSQRLPHRAVCSPLHINPSNFTQVTAKGRLELPRGALFCDRFSHSLAEETQLHKENSHGSSFCYCKRTYCLFFSEQAYITHHLSHLQTLPHIKNTIQEGHLILQTIKSIFHHFLIDIRT